jgi:formylglycine-generating enzyme required for sulfatase activity
MEKRQDLTIIWPSSGESVTNTETDQQVRLASIVAVDVAGFSTMSERDQRRAARQIEALRARIEAVAAHNGGRVFNTAGDGFMLEFPSAGAALGAINDLLDKRVKGEPAIRIGAHVGDVVVTIANDLLGHGVNVAARLQSLAPPGTALVSGEFRSMARNSPSAAFQAKGRQPLENIDQRVQTFAILSQRQRFKRQVTRAAGVGLAAAFVAGLVFAYPRAVEFARTHGFSGAGQFGPSKVTVSNAEANTLPKSAAAKPAPPPESVSAAPAAPASLKPGDTIRDCELCPELIVAPGGEFTMGSPVNERGRAKNEGPQRQVTIKPFAIGRYEVTFEQWDACASAGGCSSFYPADRGWGRGRRPVLGISWKDAQDYVAWLNAKTKGPAYRLLSEAEWEYAARAGAAGAYAFGDALNASQARFASKSTQAVGSFAANAFGVFDMYGNAAEWTADCYAPNYDVAPVDGGAFAPAKCAERVYRGGAYADAPVLLRAAARGHAPPERRMPNVGLRVARALTS